MNQKMIKIFLTVLLVKVTLVNSETKKSWRPAQPHEYLRQMHATPEVQSQTVKMDETTRVTRSLDTTTTFDGSSDSNTEDTTIQDSTTEQEESTTQQNDNQDDLITRGVRLLVMGRGKKNNWVEKLVPLFILPFLIQSAIVPFIVQTIKLLLLKSLFVGKTALLLFLLGVFKNMGKTNRSGGGGPGGVPYYLKEVGSEGPDDRLYHPGIGSYSPDIGYRVDGRPDFVSRSIKKE